MSSRSSAPSEQPHLSIYVDSNNTKETQPTREPDIYFQATKGLTLTLEEITDSFSLAEWVKLMKPIPPDAQDTACTERCEEIAQKIRERFVATGHSDRQVKAIPRPSSVEEQARLRSKLWKTAVRPGSSMTSIEDMASGKERLTRGWKDEDGSIRYRLGNTIYTWNSDDEMSKVVKEWGRGNEAELQDCLSECIAVGLVSVSTV